MTDTDAVMLTLSATPRPLFDYQIGLRANMKSDDVADAVGRLVRRKIVVAYPDGSGKKKYWIADLDKRPADPTIYAEIVAVLQCESKPQSEDRIYEKLRTYARREVYDALIELKRMARVRQQSATDRRYVATEHQHQPVEQTADAGLPNGA